MKELFLALGYFTVGHTLIWFQTNGQFLWSWFQKNPLILSLFGGTIISYTFIMGTKHIVAHMDGLLWPGSLLGFAIGTIIFAILTYVLLNEGLTYKTAVSMLLAILLLLIEILWR